MVTQRTLLQLDFTTISEYHQYIIDSIINGQKQQAKNLIKNFSKDQKKVFLTDLINDDILGPLDARKTAQTLVIDSL